MKILMSLLIAFVLMGCAANEEPELMPRSNVEVTAPWGYTDMCDDPERHSTVHCVEDEEESE